MADPADARRTSTSRHANGPLRARRESAASPSGRPWLIPAPATGHGRVQVLMGEVQAMGRGALQGPGNKGFAVGVRLQLATQLRVTLQPLAKLLERHGRATHAGRRGTRQARDNLLLQPGTRTTV